MERKLIKTNDGSHSIFVPELNEHYHSIHGAVNEALHVFIKMGFQRKAAEHKELNILEIGFGTGLNAWLTSIFSQKEQVKCNYVGLEAFPVEQQIISHLNYVECVPNENGQLFFDKIHEVKWENLHEIHSLFYLQKIKTSIHYLELKHNQFEVIYFDAFAPEKQPDMWTVEVFKNMYDLLITKGILVTYCAKGVVKRTLKSVGFEVVNLPGPPGKREMIMAVKN